jgi:hypothetical protein
MICPVGIPPAELTVALNVTGEPGAAFAGAVSVVVVASPVTSTGILAELGKKMPSPLYIAVMLWILTSVRIASILA